MDKKEIHQLRYFLKDSIRQKTDFTMTDQNQGIAMPPIEKPASPDARKIDLVHPGTWQNIQSLSVEEAIKNRRSFRKYSKESLNLDELSFLLWATQGVREEKHGHAFRTVPSAGCRHALETYLAVFRVAGLDQGLYRYLPITHQLVLEAQYENFEDMVSLAALKQNFAGNSAVTFIWTAIPYRMEWRYSTAAHKVIALDMGHVCQNLYLACTAINAGACAIAAYDQQFADSLLDIDGEDEFVIYMASVGKIPTKDKVR